MALSTRYTGINHTSTGWLAMLICDMIKQNESELTIIEFEKFPLYFIVLSITKSLEPYIQFWWGFQHNLALMLKHTLNMKTDFVFVFLVLTHFAWSHHILPISLVNILFHFALCIHSLDISYPWLIKCIVYTPLEWKGVQYVHRQQGHVKRTSHCQWIKVQSPYLPWLMHVHQFLNTKHVMGREKFVILRDMPWYQISRDWFETWVKS